MCNEELSLRELRISNSLILKRIIFSGTRIKRINKTGQFASGLDLGADMMYMILGSSMALNGPSLICNVCDYDRHFIDRSRQNVSHDNKELGK